MYEKLTQNIKFSRVQVLVSSGNENVVDKKIYRYLLAFVMKISDGTPTIFILGGSPGNESL